MINAETASYSNQIMHFVTKPKNALKFQKNVVKIMIAVETAYAKNRLFFAKKQIFVLIQLANFVMKSSTKTVASANRDVRLIAQLEKFGMRIAIVFVIQKSFVQLKTLKMNFAIVFAILK